MNAAYQTDENQITFHNPADPWCVCPDCFAPVEQSMSDDNWLTAERAKDDEAYLAATPSPAELQQAHKQAVSEFDVRAIQTLSHGEYLTRDTEHHPNGSATVKFTYRHRGDILGTNDYEVAVAWDLLTERFCGYSCTCPASSRHEEPWTLVIDGHRLCKHNALAAMVANRDPKVMAELDKIAAAAKREKGRQRRMTPTRKAVTV